MSFQIKVRESMTSKIIELSAVIIVLGVFMGIVAIPIFMGVPTTYYTNTSGTNTTVWIVTGTFGVTNFLVWGAVVTVALAAVVMLIIRMFQHKHAE